MIRLRSMVLVAALLVPATGLAQELMADNFIGKFRAWTVLGQRIALANKDGRTLYTFEKDEPGKSNCVDACATNWPPELAIADDKAFEDFTIITRADGGKQWALKGKPLYRSAKDQKPGDALGEGADDAWFIAETEAHDMGM